MGKRKASNPNNLTMWIINRLSEHERRLSRIEGKLNLLFAVVVPLLVTIIALLL